jgi:hypothetical protein
LNDLPDRFERYAESRGQFFDVFNLLISQRSPPAQPDTRLSVDRKIVHFEHGLLGILTSDVLDKPAAFVGGNLDIRDFAKVLEERLRRRFISVWYAPKVGACEETYF